MSMSVATLWGFMRWAGGNLTVPTGPHIDEIDVEFVVTRNMIFLSGRKNILKKYILEKSKMLD